ncbi:MAG: ketose-bisphosphate aldolase [Firmicutes bacterium]|nr:ketose-bisphosphate aldolase [Bacillota bacterium]
MSQKLSDAKVMLREAVLGKYAVGAFNFTSIEIMRAIIDGANRAKSPVILAMSESGLRFASSNYLSKVIKAAVEEAKVPVALHLDHGKDLALVKEVIKVGFNSVMIDGSFLAYEDNIALTKKVVDYAHERGVQVEGELGVLAGIEDDVKHDTGTFTDPEQAAEFIRRTGVDSLAIAIGTSHGAFKFKGEPKLKYDVLQEISRLVPGFPIVLHGGSSAPQDAIDKINIYGGKVIGATGMPDEMVRKATQMGVAKVNADTELRLTYTGAIREYLYRNPTNFNPRDYLGYAKEQVTLQVMDKMEKALGSAGRG